MFAFMKAIPFSAMETDIVNYTGLKSVIATPEHGTGQPQRIIPVFDLYEDALKFAGEDEKHLIAELSIG